MEDDRLILWTIQPRNIWELLKDSGIYRCEPTKSSLLMDGSIPDPSIVEKYDWLVGQMKERIGPAPKRVTYPVWAWYKHNGEHKKPDLRTARWSYGTGDEDYACIEFEIADEKVLLSDFDVWHIILNNGLISETEEEYNQLEEQYDSLPPTEQTVFKYQNWSRVFNISPLDNDWIRRGLWVQATVWELRKADVRAVRFFRTGKRNK